MGRKPMPIVVEIIGAHSGADGLDAVIVSGPATLIGRRVLVRGEDVAEVLIETTPDDDLEAAEELALAYVPKLVSFNVGMQQLAEDKTTGSLDWDPDDFPEDWEDDQDNLYEDA